MRSIGQAPPVASILGLQAAHLDPQSIHLAFCHIEVLREHCGLPGHVLRLALKIRTLRGQLAVELTLQIVLLAANVHTEFFSTGFLFNQCILKETAFVDSVGRKVTKRSRTLCSSVSYSKFLVFLSQMFDLNLKLHHGDPLTVKVVDGSWGGASGAPYRLARRARLNGGRFPQVQRKRVAALLKLRLVSQYHVEPTRGRLRQLLFYTKRYSLSSINQSSNELQLHLTIFHT